MKSFKLVNLAWIPMALIIFIIGLSCSSGFSGFMMELVR